MRRETLFLVLLTMGCATPPSFGGPWRYEQFDHSAYAWIPPGEVTELVRRAQIAFSASPMTPCEGAISLALRQAWLRPDGKRLLMFYFGSSDNFAVYVFNDRSDIVDRFVYSYWGHREGHYVGMPCGSP